MNGLFIRAGIVLFGLTVAVVAAEGEAKKAADSKAAGTKFESKISDAEKCCSRAITVNFRKELGVPLDFLSDIGRQIHHARRTPDPIALALAGQTLGVAEKVAGKKASVSSEEVLKEAVELVKMRGIASELSAMLVIATDEATQKEVQKILAITQKRDADEKAAAESGEKSKSIVGTLQVTNHASECLRIFVDGRYVGEVHQGETTNLHVHSHNNPNQLQAFCEDDNDLVKQATFFGSANFVTWHIHD